MKQIGLVIAAVAAVFIAAVAPCGAAPSWHSLQQGLAGAESQRPLVVMVRGYGHRSWHRRSFGSVLMFPPALAALMMRSLVPVPQPGYRSAVRPEPALPYAGEPESSTPWVDPDEPAR